MKLLIILFIMLSSSYAWAECGQYPADVQRVVDGDTIDLRVGLGFGVYFDMRSRLQGVDTPEVYGVPRDSEEYKKGKEASLFVKDWLSRGPIRIDVHGTGKYGRHIVEIFDGQCVSLNKVLIEKGYAYLH